MFQFDERLKARAQELGYTYKTLARALYKGNRVIEDAYRGLSISDETAKLIMRKLKLKPKECGQYIGANGSLFRFDGDELKARIKELGLDQKDFAKRCKCSATTVSKAIHGHSVRIHIAEAMIRLLGITAAEYGEVKTVEYNRIEKFRFNPAKLKARFKETGLSQSAFAARAGVGYQTFICALHGLPVYKTTARLIMRAILKEERRREQKEVAGDDNSPVG